MQKQVLFRKRLFLVSLLLILAFFSRLPLLGPDRTLLDGDEALMGLMSLHQTERGEIPVFFWGQNYGFSFIEVSAISLFSHILGHGDQAVKCGMLFLWLLTLLGFFLFLESHYQGPWAFWIVLLLAFHPSWYYWSLKARGGYMSAILCSAWIFYLAAKPRMKPWIEALLVGLLFALLYHAQKLWVPPTLMLLLGLLIERKTNRTYYIYLGCFLALALAFMHLLVIQAPNFWQPALVNLKRLGPNIPLIPERIQHMLQGNFFLADVFHVENWTYSSYTLVKGVFFFCVGLWLLRLGEIRKKRYSWFITLAMLAPFGVLLVTDFSFGPRYLLPAPFFLVFWMSEQLYVFRYRGFVYTALVICSLVFLAGSVQLKVTPYYQGMVEKRRATIEIADRLMADGYKHVLVESPAQHWQIMFYSQEKVIACTKHITDRRQEPVDSVWAAYFRGEAVPVLAFHPFEDRGLKPYFEPYGTHFILRKPTLEQLDILGFAKKYPK